MTGYFPYPENTKAISESVYVAEVLVMETGIKKKRRWIW